jgi:hypothetical protein
MSSPKKEKIEGAIGSLTVIILEVTGIFLVALFDFLVSGHRYHMTAVGALLVLLMLTYGSVYLHFRHMKKKGKEILVDDLADDLANRVTEALESAITERWPTAQEDELSRLESAGAVREVWTVGCDLATDLGCRRDAILRSLSDGKKYRYLCPHDNRPWGQLHALWHHADVHVSGFKPEQLAMKCLPGRKLPQIQLIILQPEGSVHLLLPSVARESRLLTIPPGNRLIRDIVTGFNTLWRQLPLVPHTETEHLAH